MTRLTPAQCEEMLPKWRAVQKPKEFVGLLERAMALPARNVLEIGSYFGGTVRAWQHVLPPDGLLVVVDMTFEPLDASTAPKGDNLVKTEFIKGHSSQAGTYFRVKKAFGDLPVDVVFIDGSHEASDVRRDFELYSQIVRPGGLIALHDIAECPSQPWVGVRKVWLEIKDTMPSEEIISEPAGWGGVGILVKPK